MIHAQNITFSYGRHIIVRNLSFSVSAGKCTVLAGPNGSGKSTVLSLLAGVLKPSSGKILTNGAVGYIPQGTALLEDATVEENLRFFAALAKKEVPHELPFAVEDYKKQTVSKLSGGMKKQVSIACALIGDPQIILLDEPCAALDIAFRDEMTGIVKKWKADGKAIVYVGHDPAEFYSFYDTLIFVAPKPIVYEKPTEQIEANTLDGFAEFYKSNLLNLKRK